MSHHLTVDDLINVALTPRGRMLSNCLEGICHRFLTFLPIFSSIIDMTAYVISFRVVTPHDREQLMGGIVAALEDAEYEPQKLEVRALRRRGRPSQSDGKVAEWMARRSKPFHLDIFAKYIGLSKSAAHKKLSGLVLAGAVTMQMGADGRMEYQVYRPTTRSE